MKPIHSLAALAVLALAPAAAHAQDTITACYVPKSGSVYRIKVSGTPAKCAQNHVEFSWSTGSTVQVVEEGPIQYILSGGQFFEVELECPEGTVPVSGGFTPSSTVHVEGSRRSNASQSRWMFRVRETGEVGSPGGYVFLNVLCLRS